jgi:hypothetical protein
MLQHGTVAKAQLETALHGATGRLCVSDACGRQCDSGCADPLQQTATSAIPQCDTVQSIQPLAHSRLSIDGLSHGQVNGFLKQPDWQAIAAAVPIAIIPCGTPERLLCFASLRFASLPKGSTAQRRNDVLLQALPMESARHSARATRRVRL